MDEPWLKIAARRRAGCALKNVADGGLGNRSWLKGPAGIAAGDRFAYVHGTLRDRTRLHRGAMEPRKGANDALAHRDFIQITRPRNSAFGSNVFLRERHMHGATKRRHRMLKATKLTLAAALLAGSCGIALAQGNSGAGGDK